MAKLSDTRRIRTATTDRIANLGSLLAAFLDNHPNVELATIRINEIPAIGYKITARIGPISDAAHDAAVAAALAGTRLAGPCSSCHQLAQRPPTEYCETPERHEVQP